VSFFPRIFNYFAAIRPLAHALIGTRHSSPASPQSRANRLLASSLALIVLLPVLLYAATFTIGGGAPNTNITFLFQTAYYRNGFSSMVVLPPYSNVRSLGASGLVQEFQTPADLNANNTNLVLYALIMPNQNAPASNTSVLQVFGDIYGYYNTLGPTTVGMPTSDTLTCPGTAPAPCHYQIFSNDYALFAYQTPLLNGQLFYLKDPEYTKWQSLGGLTGPVGFPTNVASTITASTGTTATEQLFSGGAFFGITSGNYNGTYSAVYGPIYTTYNSYQGPAGTIGLPLGNQITLPNGTFQQTFEGGVIQYTTGSTPILLLPVAQVRILGPGNFTTGIQMNLNDSAQLTAQVFVATGAVTTGRPVTWSVTNPSVLSLTANGTTATVKAIGGGTAQVTATVGGVASAPLPITVTAPCCAIGDGAPSSVQKAFLDALSRNNVQVTVPLPSPAQRAGAGYIQTMTPTGTTQAVLVAQADGSPLAYVVSGPILTAYQAGGGPTGTAGYPTSDVTAGGRQMFANAAIAGNPAFMVSGQILTKWSGLGYETGSTGLPGAGPSAFVTGLGESGLAQPFQGGTIYAISSGQYHGQTWLVSGLILARYNAVGGPAGAYGAPVGDETVTGNIHTQNFENGYINYSVGDAVAVDHPNPRTPAVSAYPASVVPGGRLTLTVSGFSNGATVKISVANQPDFTVTLPIGAFSWNYVVSPTAVVGSIKISAVDTASGATASGSFAIQSTASLGAKLSIVQGNSQTAGVSALLPLPLQVSVKDSNGNPLTNVAVMFVASPGATISAASAVTDANGLASTLLRLPSSVGVAEVTAQALGQFVTFGAQAVGTPALGVPAMTATSQNPLGSGPALISQQGALVTSAAMVLGYYQSVGQISSPNGTASPDTLNKYLANCGNGCDGYLTNPDTGTQVVNLWRLSGFSGGQTDVSVEKSDIASIQSLVAGRSPVLAFLALSANGVPVGGTTVVVTGVNNDGSLVILDPNPVLARTSMNDYLNGFQVNNVTWRGTIVSAARVVVQKPVSTSFILAAVSQPTNAGGVSLDIESASGPCGSLIEIPDAAVIGSASAVTLRSSRFIYCNGAGGPYQANLNAANSYRAFVEGGGLFKDLSGSSPSAYSLTVSAAGNLSVAPQTATFSSAAVLNAATFVQGLAPGGLFSIFGAGLYGPSADTTVSFGSESAQLILKSAFQLNGQVPGDLAPGSYPVTIQSAWGSATQTVSVSQSAPGIFVVTTESGDPSGPRTVGAVINQDGTLNDLATPAHRGDVLTVYCTDLGAVQAQGSLFVTVNPVTALLNTTELPVQYAGLTPGLIGLYQVNIPIPGGTAPGASLGLSIKAAGVVGNTVNVAIQ
jgi:uncharacterized protein (TIGR03437 family)